MGFIIYIVATVFLIETVKPTPTTQFILTNCKLVRNGPPGLFIRCKIGQNRTNKDKRRTFRRGPVPRPKRPLHNYRI